MSSSHKVHHKSKPANVLGRMEKPKHHYGKWAYWCPKASAWLVAPCACPKEVGK